MSHGFTSRSLDARSFRSMDLVPKAMLGLVALLLGNAFIVGINQIYDVDIDKAREKKEMTRKVSTSRCGLGLLFNKTNTLHHLSTGVQSAVADVIDDTGFVAVLHGIGALW